ncbi:AlpA family transcriptional regulator [Croceibacterium ferulae]|uniref:AlpA family transcriptional regulator n=1 Tax=Croceibacterium ferulae TaxID=1854641 RepID=UPI0030C7C557
MAEPADTILSVTQHPSHEVYVFGAGAPMTILRMSAVTARTGLSRATIYRKMREATFPRPRQLGQKAVGWLEADVTAWIAGCVEASANDR